MKQIKRKVYVCKLCRRETVTDHMGYHHQVALHYHGKHTFSGFICDVCHDVIADHLTTLKRKSENKV